MAATIQRVTIRLKRGYKSSLPDVVSPGEPLVTLDTNELFIGDKDGILQKVSDVNTSNHEPSNRNKLWWNTEDDTLRRWNGEAWTSLQTKSGGIHIGDYAPIDTSKLWIDYSDEDADKVLNSDLSTDIRNTMTVMTQKVDSLEYALKYELDPGYFKGVIPGSDPDIEVELPPDAPNLGNGAEGTVGHLLVKRGLKEDIENLQEGEMGFCLDTEELYIGNKGRLRLLTRVGGTSSGSGSGNVTADYVELISNNGKKYRLTVNDDGEPLIFNSEVDTIALPKPEDSGRFKGLIINKAYGGGNRNTNDTPVSHGFIELYNSTESTINLRGLSLQYGEYLGEWKVLPLRGEIKPFCSFLIRCAEHSDPYRQSTRYKIFNFDMGWNIPMSNKGFKIYLCVGTDASKFTNPANTDGSWTRAVGYINLFAVGGDDITRTIDGYEKTYMHYANKNRMLKRRYSEALTCNFANTGDNGMDIEFIDMRYADINIYMPKSTKLGQWDYSYDQVQLDTSAPNTINICLGYDGDTTRTFTWQSQTTTKGYIKYKKKTDISWITVESNKKFVAHPDVDVTVHSVIVKNLEPGNTYIYKAGFEGHWSDEYELEILDVKGNDKTIKMLWVTDQQGWDVTEYSAWGKANNYIENNETYDFILNTGDISQNGNRSFEWREYFDVSKNNMSTHPQMTCVGNNDLVDKLYSIAYTYYSTVENSPYPSVYSFNYGYVHFICLDSNILNEPLDATKPIRGVNEQITFIKEDMAKPENQKRWVILYIHEAPYSIVRNTKTQKFINEFYDAGIDLVLCGHHHCYTKSHRMGKINSENKDVIDKENGVYYLMMQSSGYKLSGKTMPTPEASAIWRHVYEKPGDPCYGMFEITYDKIKFNAYRLTNIIPLIDNVGKEVVPIEFDSLEILPKANRR